MSEIKVGDRVRWTIWPYGVREVVLRGTVIYRGANRGWACVENDEHTGCDFVSINRLTRLDPPAPASIDDDWLAAVAGAGATR